MIKIKNMKRYFLYTLLGAMMVTMASCDKIDKDRYLVPSGQTGEWFVSNKNISKDQRAMVEKYTGVRCVNCPEADNVIHASSERYGDKLIAVAIHSGNFGRPLGSDPDLRTESGSIWYEHFVGTSAGLPAAMVNRGELFNPLAGVDDKIEAVISQSPKVVMDIENSGDKLIPIADIHVGFEQTVNEDLTLTLLLTEDNILTTQSRVGGDDIENYAQNHVLRMVYTDVWGLPIEVSKEAGKKFFIRFYVTIPEGSVKENCHMVAFVSNKATREILNVAQCNL